MSATEVDGMQLYHSHHQLAAATALDATGLTPTTTPISLMRISVRPAVNIVRLRQSDLQQYGGSVRINRVVNVTSGELL